MTPENKKEELIKKFSRFVAGEAAIKACAIICVDEMIYEISNSTEERERRKVKLLYWQSVKNELLK